MTRGPLSLHEYQLFVITAVDNGKAFAQMQGRREDSSRRGASKLPIIAPRYESGSLASGQQRGTPTLRAIGRDAQRPRLPPRSRSGCWTCRRRKVKCDEQRPICGQCARLVHDCDYQPRLTFRDDTAKVRASMQDVTAIGASVWKPHFRTSRYSPTCTGEDSLATFSALTSDEDREQKAKRYVPGTYIVVATPDSFASLPEYCKAEEAIPSTTPTLLSPSGHVRDGAVDRREIRNPSRPLEDPNITILQKFEDFTQNQVSPVLKSDPFSIVKSLSPNQFPGDLTPILIREDSKPSKLDQAREGGQNAHLLLHYRSHISPHVIKVGLQEVEEDVFEIQARMFPPLFHAMMAISALSLAHRAGSQNAEALEHYQQVLPAMRDSVQSEEDSHSDGALFTHYLLLLYEIASAGPWESNMWQSHSRTLLNIVARRRQVGRIEPHGFLIWVICLVDTYALLSGIGDGTFFQFILENNMVAPRDILPPLAPGQSQTYFQDEFHWFPGVLELNHRVVRLALQVGQTARELREEATHMSRVVTSALDSEPAYIVVRRRRVQDIQTLCRNLPSTWEVQYAKDWSLRPAAKSLPYRARGFSDHSYSLYRVCIIYSYTSMYPGQMAEIMANEIIRNEVHARATEIIELAQQIVAEGRWELRFMPFSLFLAGVVSIKQGEKALALTLMTALEQQSYGENTATIRRLLEIIYDKQQESAGSDNQNFEVDWINEMRMSGLRLVMFSM